MRERELDGKHQVTEPTLEHAILFVERYWLTILLPTVIMALSSVALLFFFLPPTFEASATLLVVPPSVSSSLQPATLSVHGYQRLLESDEVLLETHRTLVDAGVLEPSDKLEIGGAVSSRIFVSRRQETTSLAPLLEARGRAATPEDAAAIVNTWIDVFLERTRAALQAATAMDVALVEQQYPETRGQLEERERERRSVADEYRKRIQEMSADGKRDLATFNRQSLDLQNDLITESRLMLTRLLTDALAGIRSSLVHLESDEAAQIIEEKLHQIVSIRGEMAGLLPLLELEKAITDEALWHSLVIQATEDTDLSELGLRSLVTQEVNPLYTELSLRVVDLEIELQQYVHLLPDQLPSLLMQLEKTQRERTSRLAKLRSERNLEASVMQRELNRELDALGREQSERLTQLQRPVDLFAALEEDLRRSYSQAVLAKAQVNVEGMRLAAKAVPIPTPLRRNAVPGVILATVAGLLLGATLAFAQRVHSQRRFRED
jgi:capsular polysaccharide biosynthesis protein